jgi:hypothetical protein
VLSAFESAELTVAEEDELTEIRGARRLKLKHSSSDMASFWLSLRQEYPFITKKATEALRPFSTSNLCQAGFSATNTVKSMNRSPLQTLEDLEGTLVSHPTSDKGHHEASSSTGFPLICLYLHKDFLFLLMFIL